MNLKKKFRQGIRWNILGSIFYESGRFAHQLALISILGIHTYGIVGTFFSCIYATIHFADFESATSLLPFLHQLKKNAPTYRRFMVPYIFFNLTLLFAASFFVISFYPEKLFPHSLLFAQPLFLLLVVSEGLRMFFRFLLQTNFQARQAVIVDLSLTIFYYAAVWLPYFFLKTPLSLSLIFLPYLISSILATLAFSLLLLTYTQQLSQDGVVQIPKNIIGHLFRTRFLNYITHISNQLFTGNFLAPLFALKFGVAYAGILKLASYLADGIKAIIKVSIGFSGSALLAQLKTKSFYLKKRVFQALWKTFNTIMYPIIIFLLINLKKVLFLFQRAHETAGSALISTDIVISHNVLVLVGILLLISLTEHLFVAYEEFYLMEERIGTLCGFKIFELLLFYGIILVQEYHSAFITLMGIVVVRMISFLILTLHAYSRWKIRPSLQVKPSVLLAALGLSFCFFYFF